MITYKYFSVDEKMNDFLKEVIQAEFEDGCHVLTWAEDTYMLYNKITEEDDIEFNNADDVIKYLEAMSIVC